MILNLLAFEQAGCRNSEIDDDQGFGARLRRHHIRLTDPLRERDEPDAQLSRPGWGLWAEGKLVGKVGSAFTSSATQHGGQESTILTFIPTLLDLGMIVVGLPYTFQGQMGLEEIKGGSPYGAATIAGADGSRKPSAAAKLAGQEIELERRASTRRAGSRR